MKNKGEYITRTILIDHPRDIGLPEKERRVLFTYKIEIKDIDLNLVENVNPGKVEYKLREHEIEAEGKVSKKI